MEVYCNPNWAKTTTNEAISLWASDELSCLKSHNPILWIGGVHGDEPEGIALSNITLEWLKNNSHQVKKHWVLIPCINPEGAKNDQRTNSRGVDLNRNFPSRNWSSEHKESRYYPGPSPMSEPEVKALVELIQQVKPVLIIHCHSWHPSIVISGPIDHPAAKALAKSSGYKIQPDIGYPTPGSLGDWGWMDQKIPVICIEEAEETKYSEIKEHFLPALAEIFLT